MVQSNDLLMQPLSDDELAGITGGNSDEDMLNECLNNCEITYPNMKAMRLRCRIACMSTQGFL